MGKATDRKVREKFDPNTMSLDPDIIRMTPERAARGLFRSAGMARRQIPVIDTLFDAGQLTAMEYDALAHYRNQALQAEDDAAQEGTLAPSRIMGGGGCAPGSRLPSLLVFTPASVEAGRIERELGTLLDIARAVAVDDLSLTQWCIVKHGGRERYDGKGRFVAVVPINEKQNVNLARLDLKMAARRISR